MSTRFYFGLTTPAPISGVVKDTGWDYPAASFSGGAYESTYGYPCALVRRAMPGTGAAVRLAMGSSITVTDSSGAANNHFMFQAISEPLAAQTITGTFKGQFWYCDSAAAADVCCQCIVRVVSNDGTTVRGTLVAANNGALSNEILNSVSQFRNVKLPRNGSVSVSSVDAQAGDRIVVEVGVRFCNLSGTAYTATGWGGCGYASSGVNDLAENETDVVTIGSRAITNAQAWVEFSQNLTFLPQYIFSVDVADSDVSLIASAPPPAGDVTSPTVTLVSPAEGTDLAPTQPIVIDVTDDEDLAYTAIYALYETRAELVYDFLDTTMATGYTVLSQAISGGYRYTITRNGRWQSVPTIRVRTIDTAGNI